MTGLVTLGETMGLFRAKELGSLATVDEFQLAIGGAESNVAIGMARLGAPAAWIGRLGADGIGRRIERELRAENVDARCIIDDSARTGLMVKEQRTPSATSVTYYRSGSAGSKLCLADLDADLIRAAKVLHVTGITLALSDSARDAIYTAVDMAVAAGVPVSFDINHRASLWNESPAAHYRAIAERSTIVFAGDDEAALLTAGETPIDLATGITRLGAQQAIVKLGAAGCVALIDGVEYSMPAIRVDVVDTVGAGDAFVAGYLTEMLAGAGPTDRLATAVRTGAFACMGPGDWESYAHRDDLALLEQGDPVSR